jgi:opacity protein-like surface antigen
MLRLIVPALLSVTVVADALAQAELSLHAGVHFDRVDHPDRILTDGNSVVLATKGDATVLGARAGYWFHPALGVQLDLSRSSNSSWARVPTSTPRVVTFSGSGTIPSPSPADPSDFVNRTTYLSVRGIVRTAPGGSFQLYAAAGPALIVHGGSGTSLLSRSTDPGGVLEAGFRVRVARRVGVELAVSNYLYDSRFIGPADGTISDFRDDVLVTPGLVYTW